MSELNHPGSIAPGGTKVLSDLESRWLSPMWRGGVSLVSLALLACGGGAAESSNDVGSGGSVGVGGSSATGGSGATGGTTEGTGGVSPSGGSTNGAGDVNDIAIFTYPRDSLTAEGTDQPGVFPFGILGSNESESVFGPCRIISSSSALVDFSSLRELGAGTLTITSSAISGTGSMTIGSDAKPVIAALDDYAFGEETIHVAASGGVRMSAFETDVTVPLTVIVKSPEISETELVASRDADFVFSWDRGAANTTVLVSGWAGNNYERILCEFESLSGTGTIPSAAMKASNVNALEVETVRHHEVSVGTESVHLRTRIGVRHMNLEGTTIKRISVE